MVPIFLGHPVVGPSTVCDTSNSIKRIALVPVHINAYHLILQRWGQLSRLSTTQKFGLELTALRTKITVHQMGDHWQVHNLGMHYATNLTHSASYPQ